MIHTTRRRLVRNAAAVGAASTFLRMPLASFAQDATPAATGEVVKSQTREEFEAQIIEELGIVEGTSGGSFIDSAVADIQTLMPLLAEEADSLGVAGLLYDTLVGSDPTSGQPAPNGLADSWEVAADGVTYTFYLNKDATWHDGTPVTADDVIFSLDALANENTGSVYTGSFLAAAKEWSKVDDHTVQIVANEPLFTFLYDIVLWVIPKHIWESVPVEEWGTDPGATGEDPTRVIGSGPFTFGEWKQGESVTLNRNDNYFGKVPYLDSYVRIVWPDQTAVVNALINGEVDVAGLEPAEVEEVKTVEGINIEIYPTRGFTYLEYNLDPEVTTMFEDERVRQALFYALDRESIVNDILLGYAEVAVGTQPVISYAYAPEEMTTTYTYDPEKAKALLEEAGWTDSDGDGIVDKDGVPMSFEYLYPAGSPTSDQMAAYIQDAWKAIGVDMTPKSLEFPALIEATTTNPTYAIAAYGFGWDATFIQDAMFGCAQYQVGFNDMKYCNPALDEINAEAKRTFDEAKRRELLIEATNIVNDEVPVMVLHFGKAIAAYSDRLQNFKPSAWGGIPFTYTWIEE